MDKKKFPRAGHFTPIIFLALLFLLFNQALPTFSAPHWDLNNQQMGFVRFVIQE